MKTSKRGISLIVLVITIIVMIILATAIILSISGSDVRGKAEEAVDTTDISTAKEIVAVAQSEWELNYDELEKEHSNFKTYATKKLEKAGITNVQPSNTGAVNIIYTDKNGDTAIIPEGFVVSSVASENTVENGLVIYKGNEAVTDDNVSVAQETRDQFVWVPVPNFSKFQITATYDGETITPPFNLDTVDYDFSEPYDALSTANDSTGEWKEWRAMRESVQEYGGFYIGRYETGTNVTRTNTSPVTEVMVQKNKDVYNYVQWGTSMTEIGTKGAVYLARKAYNTSSVKSTLCYGVQWDAVMNFMRDVENPNHPGYKYIENSDGMAWATYSIYKTGKDIDNNKSNMVKNIYDIAGHVSEWTMEATAITGRVLRHGADLLPSDRGFVSPYIASEGTGFRISLYLK